MVGGGCPPPGSPRCRGRAGARSAPASPLLIEIKKQPGVRTVCVGEPRRSLFANIVLKVTRPEETMLCKYDQLCAGIKAGIDGAIHGV